MPETKRPLKVFLCHAHADREIVRALYARLKREGVDVWLDKEKLIPGADWEFEIRQAVRESDVVVVCLSKQFNQSGFRQNEVKIALDTATEQPEGEIFIIPARLEECESPANLSRWHWVDLYEEDGHQRLIQALRLRAGRIGATLRVRRGGQSISSLEKNKEPDTLTEVQVSNVNIGDTFVDTQKASTMGEEKSEHRADKKETLEETERQKAEKTPQPKAKRKPTERTKQGRVAPQAARIDVIGEALNFITRSKFTLLKVLGIPSARRIVRLTGIIIVLLLVTSWAIRQRFQTLPIVTPNATMALATSEVVETDMPQETRTPVAMQPAPSESTSPSSIVLGGADKIAFVANGDIWLMNVDGSDLNKLTRDGGAKSDLQWLPGGEIIIYISGLTVKYVNITTGAVEALTNFPTASSLNAFRVSHDGKEVMISLNNEIFVVPFDFERMKNVHKKSDLLPLEGCIYPEPKTRSELVVREALWSVNDKLVAWLFKGVDSVRNQNLLFDQVSVLDISKCLPAEIDQLDNFPAQRFKPVSDEPVEYNDDGSMPDLDWDGNDLFVFNTNRQDGWGELYVYNWNTKRAVHNNLIDGICCYRDARWSPDGLYLFFAYRDHRLGAEAPTLLYYVLYREGAGRKFDSLVLPDGFFTDRKEAPQPALRPAN